MTKRQSLYALLALVFLVAAAYQGRFIQRRIEYLARPSEQVQFPLDTRFASNEITVVASAAEQAGIRKGDRLLDVEGQPYTGNARLADILFDKRPGDTITVTVEPPSADGVSQPRTVTVELAAISPERYPDVASWVFVIFLTLLLPVFCMVAGFYVAAVRVWDRLAWILLALMLCFSQLALAFDALAWKGALRVAAIVYVYFCWGTTPIWMLLFGIHFPERLALDRRRPWLKWLIIAPLMFSTLTNIILRVGSEYAVAAIAPLAQAVRPYDVVFRIIGMMAFGGFFACIGYKRGTTKSPDERRRLKFMLYGAYLSLTPAFVMVIISLITGKPPAQSLPGWAGLIALLLLCLFPLTLAYVIVVQRAMDVRVAIRQGVQYAFARSGVQALRWVLSGIILLSGYWLLTRPDANWLATIIVIGVGVALLIVLRRAGDRVAHWVDRRFFREAYNTEQILSELSEEVRLMVETDPLLETVARRVSESLHVPRVTVMLEENGDYRPAYALGYESRPPVSFAADAATVARLKRESEPLRVYFDDPESWVYKQPEIEAEREALKHLDSQLLLPLAVKDRLPGFISLSPKRSEEPYSHSDLRLLQSVAAQTGLALENSHLTERVAAEAALRERLNREVEIAREVQERLFPQKLPTISGLDYSGACRPALGVGGDYYDFLLLPNDRFGIAIGDVSGKGIAAALLMASLQASLRGQAIQGQENLAQLMGNVNRLVYDASAENRYATFFYAEYKAQTHELTYVNAGHNAPIILRRAEGEWQIIRLEVGGAVVGLLPRFPYQQETVKLERGDVLIGFTDGISEAMNPEDEEWGEEQLIAALKTCNGLSASETIARLVSAADAFAAGAKQHDDMTIVIVRVV